MRISGGFRKTQPQLTKSSQQNSNFRRYKRKNVDTVKQYSVNNGGGGGIIGGGKYFGGGDGNGWNEFIDIMAQAPPSDQQKSQQKQKPITLTLASFAVTKLAYTRITKLFRQYYKENFGREVRFRLTFAGSGVQARAVIDGLPADLVALALPLDIQKICEAGLISTDWRSKAPNNAICCESVVAVVTREGNPKQINDWQDLTQEGLGIITANPKTGGGARWNFLALWGHNMNKESAAIDFVTEVFNNVPVQPRDSREASDVFYNQLKGDALLTYENEVKLTNMNLGDGKALPYVVPQNNIRVECPIAIVDKVVDDKAPEVRHAAEEFIKFLYTPQAQEQFVKYGFRPVTKDVKLDTSEFPTVKKTWRVEEKLGGWSAAQEKFFDKGGILDEIQEDIGQKRAAEAMGKKYKKP